MTRQSGDVRFRLQQAALALFGERGYDRVTATEIAARAGVTERTFFRHFADKREVLFEGEQLLGEALDRSIFDAPAGLGPLDTLFHAFRSVRQLLEDNRSFAMPRHDVIVRTPVLRERELTKIAALTTRLAAALKTRGVADLEALLAAHAGMAAFVHATVNWLEDGSTGLAARLDQVERELKALR